MKYLKLELEQFGHKRSDGLIGNNKHLRNTLLLVFIIMVYQISLSYTEINLVTGIC